MSDSVWPHRRQPTRLPRPWDSPGKNTGVGCHFLLQCMNVKSESEVTQSCPTLCDPMDCSLPYPPKKILLNNSKPEITTQANLLIEWRKRRSWLEWMCIESHLPAKYCKRHGHLFSNAMMWEWSLLFRWGNRGFAKKTNPALRTCFGANRGLIKAQFAALYIRSL